MLYSKKNVMWIHFARFNENDHTHSTYSKLNWSKSVNNSRGYIAGQMRLTMTKNHEYAYSVLNTNDLVHWYTHIHKPDLRSKDCIPNVSLRSVDKNNAAFLQSKSLSYDLCALDFMRFYDFNGNSKCNVCSLHIIWSKSNICSCSVSKSG